MSKRKSPVKKTRLTLDLPLDTRQKIHKAMVKLNADSQTEVVRRAVNVLLFILTAESEGDETIIRRKDGVTHIKLLL